MARGGWKYEKGVEAEGAEVENIKDLGSRTPDTQELLQGGGAGEPPVWSRDMGNAPHDCK